MQKADEERRRLSLQIEYKKQRKALAVERKKEWKKRRAILGKAAAIFKNSCKNWVKTRWIKFWAWVDCED